MRVRLPGFYLTADKGQGWFRFFEGFGFCWYSERVHGPYRPRFSEREGWEPMPRNIGPYWFKTLRKRHV